LGCLLPMLAQLPIWFALYSVLRLTVGDVPESTINLSKHLYPWSFIQQAVPLSNKFLGLNLGQPNVLLAIATGATMFVQQKMTTPPAMDERSQSMNSTMLWMMPLMFTYFAISFPSGLALYWVVSSVVSVILQYIYVGSAGSRGALSSLSSRRGRRKRQCRRRLPGRNRPSRRRREKAKKKPGKP